MANRRRPACLRLRVVADPATIDPRFLVDEARLDRIASVIERTWPAEIDESELREPKLWVEVEAARAAVLDTLGLDNLSG